jgi:hypothetical protein
MSHLKSKLLSKQRRTASTLSLRVDEEMVSVDIIKPTLGDKLALLEKAQRDGLCDGEGRPLTPSGGAQLAARMVVMLVREKGVALFTEDEVADLIQSEHFEELSSAAGAVFRGERPAGKD